MSCVIQEFFGSLDALFCGTSHYAYAILDRIGNRAGCTRSLLRRFRDVFNSSFHHGL